MNVAFEATAPAHVALAGGTLDALLTPSTPEALVVSAALDRRAWCRAERLVDGVRIESKDTLERAEGRDVEEILASGRHALAGSILRALGIASGIRLVIQSRVPAAAGLGGSHALALAIAAAASRAVGREASVDALRSVSPEWPASYGGIVATTLKAGVASAERVPADPGRVEECLSFVDVGPVAASSAPARSELVPVGGEEASRATQAVLVSVARRLQAALLEGRYDDVTPLLAEEWRACRALVPGIATPAVERVVDAVAAAGGAAKVSSGSVVAVWAPPGARAPGTREAVEAALAQAGFRSLRFRLDLRGLEVESA